ncbi:MAG: transcriptional repressor LexA [Planctomycetes bacterium]|nr:transcriptional repressor LexA [Planctomycetota bacterium]
MTPPKKRARTTPRGPKPWKQGAATDPVRNAEGKPSLTKRQAEVLRFVAAYRDKEGLSPTLEEIGEASGVSRVTIFEHIRALEQKGYVVVDSHQSRSIRLCNETPAPQQAAAAGTLNASAAHTSEPREMPILGRIAAGQPIEAVEDREAFDVDAFFRQDRGNFMLEVRGNSMIEDQIRDGDFVLVEPRMRAHPGETVVALINGEEATLKRFYPEHGGEYVRLEPRNASMQPIVVAAASLSIQGVVIGVVRKY